ncbi:MAG: sensor domain-containing diguanylate cyclase [Acetobacterium sp.]
MDYRHYSKEQLILMTEELELLSSQLLDVNERENQLGFSGTSNLGFWYWNVQTRALIFNPLKATNLGYDPKDIPKNATHLFFTGLLHPDDYPNVMAAMRNHLQGKTRAYEVEYQIKTKNDDYKWYYSLGKITKFDDQGKPLFLAGIVFDVTENKEMSLDLFFKNRILGELSKLDGLTKVKNIRELFEHLKAEISRGLVLNEPLSVALFDPDGFNNTDETKGDFYGAAILINVAQIMGSKVLGINLDKSYDGEEFMIIFPKSSKSLARCISERIRQAIKPPCPESDITITIGSGVDGFLFATVKMDALKYKYVSESF